ncbi:MAG: hypothetical protein HT580_04930 [Dechloromonas sp.]|nr:MAG: hypothetical protein HT580_04930 [Dechloromonas sp.]
MEALETKRLFHLIGGYGISKTKTLERFAQAHPMTHETPGAAYFALTDEDRTTTQIYQRISDAMRVNEKFAAWSLARTTHQERPAAWRPADYR